MGRETWWRQDLIFQFPNAFENVTILHRNSPGVKIPEANNLCCKIFIEIMKEIIFSYPGLVLLPHILHSNFVI